ncbi:MAG: hypothetical protein FWF08_07330 [Oscillospiraceae bacterium]|nr:hypothetical protein [Oscillospiraceae bacterium]
MPVDAPPDLIIKSREDLIQKLEEGIKDTESGNVCFLEEAFAEIDELLHLLDEGLEAEKDGRVRPYKKALSDIQNKVNNLKKETENI